MIGYENLGIKRNENEKSYRKYSENSDTKTCDESFNKSIQKNERHVTFQTNFLIVIDVESWRKYNIDVTEKDPNWHKVESEPEEKNIEEILNRKIITPVNENLINNDKQLNVKKDKISCQCAVF